MKETQKKTFTLKTLTKSSVWDIQENDVFRMWNSAEKDADLRENLKHYLDVIRSAFEIEEIKIDKPEVVKKITARGFKVGNIKIDENTKVKLAVKKRPISRVTDLTYENIRHISAAKLIEVLDRNFGGGWDSLSQSIKDIIQSGFDISTTTLPKDRLRKPGGMYEKMMNEGFEVLEIAKGMWVEAIFAKVKPIIERPKMKFNVEDEEKDYESDEDLPDRDDYDEDADEYDEDKLTEESYRTTIDTDPEEPVTAVAVLLVVGGDGGEGALAEDDHAGVIDIVLHNHAVAVEPGAIVGEDFAGTAFGVPGEVQRFTLAAYHPRVGVGEDGLWVAVELADECLQEVGLCGIVALCHPEVFTLCKCEAALPLQEGVAGVVLVEDDLPHARVVAIGIHDGAAVIGGAVVEQEHFQVCQRL